MAILIHARLRDRGPDELVYDVDDSGKPVEIVVPLGDLDPTAARNPGLEFVAERVAARVASLHRRSGEYPDAFSILLLEDRAPQVRSAGLERSRAEAGIVGWHSGWPRIAGR